MRGVSSGARELSELRVILVGNSDALVATQMSLPPNVATKLIRVANVLQALDAAQNDRPDVIFLDSLTSHRPVSEVARWLGADDRTSGVPIMFVTAKPAPGQPGRRI